MSQGPSARHKKQRGERGERSPKRGVLEHAKRREVVEQLFVEQPIEHLVGPRQEPLQGMLDVGAARTLEQNHVARMRDPAQVFARRDGIGEKKRGVTARPPSWLRPPK